MDIGKYIFDQALILVPVLYCIGMVIKTSAVNDKFIPIILTGISIVLSVLLLGFSIQSVIQGVLIAGVTVYGNQVVKQSKKIN